MTGLPDKISEHFPILRGGAIVEGSRQLLAYLGEDPSRDGLLETPERHIKGLRDLTSGYNIDAAALLKTFENDAQMHDMVVVADIPFYSLCEHHLLPFFGHAHVAYIPSDRIVGLSKFARVVDAYARRLQVQERLTQQITDTIDDAVKPLGVGVVVVARHMCMEARGVTKSGATTTTSAMRGVFIDKPEARAELMSLALKGST